VLRRQIGPSYPVGLTSFPYTDYHPAFPYSVFLGPGAAQYNLPQIYWKTIGDPVDVAYDHTWVWNRFYERPIMPLGQVYLNPRPRAIRRFRKLAIAHGFRGVSWWSWQHARRRQWRAISRRIVPLRGFEPYDSFPFLRRGSAGDAVVWAQQLLAGGGYMNRVTGYFRSATRAALIEFQAERGLAQTGTTNRATWKAMLANLEPRRVRWTPDGAVIAASGKTMPEPRSAELPARRYEIPPRGRRSPRG
jgi:Putative peptidoglycan binding domain